MEEARPNQRPRRRTEDSDGDDDDGVEIEWNSVLHYEIIDWNEFIPDEIISDMIMTYLDVRSLVEIKLVSRKWQTLSTRAIDMKGVGTKTRKAFETNEELRNAVQRYCPDPIKDDITYPIKDDITITTATQQYCDREIAEEIACTYGWPISKWDVSNIEDFSYVFYGTNSRFNPRTQRWEYSDGITFFNEAISSWNVSMATTMESMFYDAIKFNQDLSTWNVSNVTTMKEMFYNAVQFNQDLSTWNVSNVTTMEMMFGQARQFNQDLSTWNVSNVTSMYGMFQRATLFNQDLSTWNISSVTNMVFMFCDAEHFNQNLSTWNVSNVTSTSGMLERATLFNQDVSSWEGWDLNLNQLGVLRYYEVEESDSSDDDLYVENSTNF